MINLIRNELCKLLHKKGIYIYTAIILVLMTLVMTFNKLYAKEDNVVDKSYIKVLENDLDMYNLKNEEELEYYVSDLVLIDTGKLKLKYKYEEPRTYYIDTTIAIEIESMYTAKYIEKNDALYEQYKSKVELLKKKLDNYDPEEELKNDFKDKEEEIRNLKLTTNEKGELIQGAALKVAEMELWCLEYRIDNKIYKSYSDESLSIDNYETVARSFLEIDKDVKLMKKDELREYNVLKKEYLLAKYKLEHKIIGDENEFIDLVSYSFDYLDGFVVMAIIFIAGALISDEFSKGTIKQLLIKPYSRSKILISKFVAAFLVFLLFCLVYYSTTIVIYGFQYSCITPLFGNIAIYNYGTGIVEEVNLIGHCLYGFASVLPCYLIMLSLLMCVGALSTNTAATTVTGFGVFFLADFIHVFLNDKVISFLPTYCWDLTSYMYGSTAANMSATLGKSLIIDIITIGLLVGITFVVFNKKDIKNQ